MHALLIGRQLIVSAVVEWFELSSRKENFSLFGRIFDRTKQELQKNLWLFLFRRYRYGRQMAHLEGL